MALVGLCSVPGGFSTPERALNSLALIRMYYPQSSLEDKKKALNSFCGTISVSSCRFFDVLTLFRKDLDPFPADAFIQLCKSYCQRRDGEDSDRLWDDFSRAVFLLLSDGFLIDAKSESTDRTALASMVSFTVEETKPKINGALSQRFVAFVFLCLA